MNSPFTKLKYLHVMLLKTPIPNRKNIYLITCRLSGLQLGTVSEKTLPNYSYRFEDGLTKHFHKALNVLSDFYCAFIN